MAKVSHLPISPNVFEVSWGSVFAETMALPPMMQLMNQWVIHAAKADLPGPRPLAIAHL